MRARAGVLTNERDLGDTVLLYYRCRFVVDSQLRVVSSRTLYVEPVKNNGDQTLTRFGQLLQNILLTESASKLNL